MDTLSYLIKKYRFDAFASKVEIPNTNRVTLAELFGELGFKVGAEVGVERGLYTLTLASNNPDGKVYGVDAWKAYRGYRDHVSQDKLDRFYDETAERVKDFNVELIKGWSVDAASKFEDESLDWVYIDANHNFINVAKDLDAWVPKVKKGGIISGHDYIKRSNPSLGQHVVEVVDAYVAAYKIKPLIILGRKEKIDGELRDNNRSWMWVKQ